LTNRLNDADKAYAQPCAIVVAEIADTGHALLLLKKWQYTITYHTIRQKQ